MLKANGFTALWVFWRTKTLPSFSMYYFQTSTIFVIPMKCDVTEILRKLKMLLEKGKIKFQIIFVLTLELLHKENIVISSTTLIKMWNILFIINNVTLPIINILQKVTSVILKDFLNASISYSNFFFK